MTRLHPWPKWLRVTARVIGAVLALILALALFLGVSIQVDGRRAAERIGRVSNTTIAGLEGPDVPAYVASPEGPGPYPTVIMVHEFWGLNPDIVSKADLLAKEGYLVVAPNVFRGSTTGYLPRAIYQVASTPAEEINEDLDAVFVWVRNRTSSDPGRVGITGFCFGGRTSLLYSLHNPSIQATSVFYGEPVTDPDRLASLGGPVLGVFGGADASIPLKNVRAFERGLRQAGIESTVTVYPNQPHAFVKNAEEIATDPAQAQAWEQMVRFFDDALKGSGTGATAPARTRIVSDFYGWVPIARLALGHGAHPGPWDATSAGHGTSH